MEEPHGSVLNRVVGVGMRHDATGKLVPVADLLFCHHANVVKAFELFPITKYFGLDVDKAMALPLDQWFRIRDSARTLAASQGEPIEVQLLQLIRELTTNQGGGGE